MADEDVDEVAEHLTEREQEARLHIRDGGTTVSQLSEGLGVSESRARAYISAVDVATSRHSDTTAIQSKQLDTGKKFYLEVLKDDAGMDALESKEQSQPDPVSQIEVPLSPGEQSSRTRKAKDVCHDMQTWLNSALLATEPTQSPVEMGPSKEGTVDVVVQRGDDHIGQVATVPNQNGTRTRIYDTPTAISSIRYVSDEVIHRAPIRTGDRDIETVHYCLNGDTVTGTNVYRNQAFDVDRGLYEQVFLGATVHFEEILKFAEAFPRVVVHCQHGNHGRIYGDGMDPAFNADRIAYGIIDLMLRMSGPDNVYMDAPNEKEYTNFQVRGWDYHMRHGDKYLEHVGTSSGKNRARGDRIKYGSTVILRNHYHTFKVEGDMDYTAVMGPSLAPPAEFEDELSEWSAPAGLFMVSSDEEPVMTYEPIPASGVPDAPAEAHPTAFPETDAPGASGE